MKDKDYFGFSGLADAMLADSEPGDVVLVSSDATGEGMFIADVALGEERPGHVVKRASKSLASSTWSGSGYTAAFQTADEVYAYLTSGKIRYLMVDDAVPDDKRRAHHDQIQRAIEQHRDRLWIIAESDVWRDGQKQKTPARLYKISRKN